MFRFAIVAALALTPTLTPAVAPAALAADPASKQASAPVATTATFVAQAAFGTMFEIESSKLALERSKAAPVKAFAQRMVDDHSAAAVKFKEAVLEAKLAMPPDKLDAKHQAVLGELADKQGDDFDKAYIEAQYKAHVETVELFKGYAQAGEDTRMRAFAAELLPTLQAHLDHVAKMR
jgi:putative membrane protein